MYERGSLYFPFYLNNKIQSKMDTINIATKDPVVVSKKVKIMPKERAMLPGYTEDDYIPHIGAGFTKPVLTEQETIDYMPHIIEMSANHDDFLQACRNYFRNIKVPVPHQGKELEIGFIYANEEEKAKGDKGKRKPIKYEDYVLYRHCLVYSRVANTPEEQNNSKNIWFYILDEEKEVRAKASKVEKMRRAIAKTNELINDRVKVKYILTISADELTGTWELGKIPTEMSDDDMDVKIFELAQNHPTQVLKLIDDPDLEPRAMVTQGLLSGVLTRYPHTDTIVFGEGIEAVTLGNSVSEAIAFLRKAENVTVRNLIVSTLNFDFVLSKRKAAEVAKAKE